MLLLPSCKHGCAKKEDNFIKGEDDGWMMDEWMDEGMNGCMHGWRSSV